MHTTVANQFPTINAPRRIAVVGEAPGEREQLEGKPFVGPSGQLLTTFLAHAGIDREACFIGNVTGHRPPGNKIELFKWTGEEVQSGLKQLADDLRRFQPHFVLVLGGTALRAFIGAKASIDDYRGTLFTTAPDSPFPGVKAMGTYHPARVLREFGLTGVCKFDYKRAAVESRTDELVVPVRNVTIMWSEDEWTAEAVVAWLHELRANRTPTDLDIEGGCGFGPACIGFATTPNDACVIPFYDVDGHSIWNEAEECAIVEAVAAYLEDPTCPKRIMNALYELFVLAWTWGVVIDGLVDDIMLKHFELFCELEKALEFQASIYTRQPHWKLEHRFVEGRYKPFRHGRAVTSREWYVYNGTDCCVTRECNDAMEPMLKPQQREHYRFNLSLLAPLLYMELRGMRYDRAEAERRLEVTQQRIYELQDEINREAARGGQRPALTAFYEALNSSSASGQHLEGCGEATGGVVFRREALACSTSNTIGASGSGGQSVGLHAGGDTDGGEAGATVGGAGQQLPDVPQLHGAAQCGSNAAKLLPLLTEAFCDKTKLRERREVEVVTYAPHVFNGKRWVKKGKRLAESGDWPTFEEAPDPIKYQVWAKPVRTTKERTFPITPASLEDVRRFAKDSARDACKRALALLRDGGALGAGARGELATLLDLHVKVNSTGDGGDAQWFLYTHCALSKQFQKEGNKLTTRLATDDEALIKAYLKSGRTAEQRDQRAMTFLKMRRAITQTKFLEAEPDADGRIRSAINLVATPTCRMAMYGSPTGTSDLNLQTIGKELRSLFLADEGCIIGQRDLSNSDAYSVAAFCAMLGDSNMLDDLRAKIKPANVLARIYEAGPSVNQLTRDELREECKKVDGEGWLYFACKRVLHGSNYGMGKVTMANQILTDSFKLLGEPIWLEPAACERIQERAFFVRYPGVRRWHDWMARELKEKGLLVTSTGFQRRVFGRKDDHSTLKELLAHFPQYFTTLAIKSTLISPKGLPRQWTDPENRREDGSLRVEPLLLVHDSNVSQWRVEDTDFAKRKLVEWFNNEITVAGLTLVIPASGSYGPNWKDQVNGL